MKSIIVKNVTKNNLKSFSVKIPLQKLVVIVGPSGSGKSTLVHEVLFKSSTQNEGQIQNLPANIEMIEQKVILPPNSKLSLGEFNLAKLKKKLSDIQKKDLLIVDEPCAGFCRKEREQIAKILRQKVADGYSIIAVEHNKEIIKDADYIIELGPGAGRYGGKLIFAGTNAQFKKSQTITAKHVFETKRKNYVQKEYKKSKAITISK